MRTRDSRGHKFLKFICYDEKNDARKLFLQRTVGAASAFSLLNETWGYVLPSDSGGDTYAYTCYFEGVPTCLNFSSTEYGLSVPYEQGFMSSAKRESNNDDTVVRGLIQTGSVVQLNYNTNTYDMNFRISMIDAPRMIEALHMGANSIQKHEGNGNKAYTLHNMGDNLNIYRQRRIRQSPNTKY